jgi:hypothetical protein
MAMLALSNAILLFGVGTRNMMSDANLAKKRMQTLIFTPHSD